MNKFSVIIPTIWKGKYLNELLESLYKTESIDEVILINNDKKQTKQFPKNEKLTLIEPKQNIYVNPSWNAGVSVAKNNAIIIAQDDLLFNPKTLCDYINLLELNNYPLKNLGFIGMSYGNYFLDTDAEEISIEECQHTPGWATIITFHRDNWIPIPHQLKIYYGDDFIKYVPRKPVTQIRGMCVKTEMSTSSNSNDQEIIKVLENDRIFWNQLINKK